MKKYLILGVVALAYTYAHATPASQELKTEINEYIEQSPSGIKQMNECGWHKLDLFAQKFKNLSQEEQHDVLREVDFIGARHTRGGNSIYWEFAAVGLGTWALKKALTSYFTTGAGRFRSAIGWTTATLGALGTYMGAQLYLNANLKVAKPDIYQSLQASAAKLVTAPALITGAAGLALAATNFTGYNNKPHAGKRALAYGALMAGCSTACMLGTKNRFDSYIRWTTARQVYIRLAETPAFESTY